MAEGWWYRAQNPGKGLWASLHRLLTSSSLAQLMTIFILYGLKFCH